MQTNSFLLYGANGYTGQLITELAVSYGLQPILAGRSEGAIRSMAEQYNLPYRIADLNNREALQKALEGVSLVLHAAGPFKYTAKPMIAACLANGVHYTDITGEIEVFEMAKQYGEGAKEAGVMVMPGVGYDVVLTDCLALFLKQQLWDAYKLKLAFATLGGRVSHGTASTLIEGLGEAGAVREHGVIVRKPVGHKGMWVNFGSKNLFTMTIPWGDVSTAFYTTGIPNIECYAAAPRLVYYLMKLQKVFNPLLRIEAVRTFFKKRIKNRPAGPSAAERKNSKSLIWGEVLNKNGERVKGKLTCADGYTLTAHSSLIIAKKILNGQFKTGYQTPAGAFGADLILEVPGSVRTLVQ